MSSPPRIFYGSLEYSERVTSSPPPAAPPQTEYLPLSQRSLESQENSMKAIQEFEMRKKAKNLAIPTDDKVVQAKLRELGEPIILFGEQALERRERLRDILTKRGIEDGTPSKTLPMMLEPKDDRETFYTEGTQALKNARIWIAKYSIKRAKERIEHAKRQRETESDSYHISNNGDNNSMEIDKPVSVFQRFEGFTSTASQVGDERTLSFCQFSKDSKYLATAAWSGLCKVWKASDYEPIQTFKGHRDRATCMTFHPEANEESKSMALASCAADSDVMLWSFQNSAPLQTLKGHTSRVNRVAFHPSGKYLGSVSHDMTWRLWDLETGKELLEQEGHSRPIYCLSFQCDGSLVVTAGADFIGRVWDLRSGKSIYVLRGHSKTIYGIDWHPNGYQIASCGEDDSIRIWDMRKKRPFYTLPAHESVISHLKFHSSELMLSSSFDTTVKLWSPEEWLPIKTFKGSEGKVMCADISPDMSKIVAANFDRTFRVFSKE